MQKEEYLIKNACYSVTKYYLCKRNNKRSLLGRKQRSQVARLFPNRYQFSCTNKVTSLFSISCILRIILHCKRASIVLHMLIFYYIISFPRLCIYSLSVSYNTLFASHTVPFCKERIPIFHGKRVL